MAVLKHIASKNSNYTDILQYLLFQHDEISGKPILDGQGHILCREEYFMDGINCEPMLFDEECERLNKQYHKNEHFNEIKSHHYIISFDPRDRSDHGLTGERAHTLGLKFAQANFPGHQTLVVTHTDGHNGSGNIHVHIVINSLRMLDIERQDYMSQPGDHLAGFKHHLTKDYLRHLKQSLMEMCQQENLYQVDLLSPAKDKVTDKEYWAARRESLTSSDRPLAHWSEQNESQEKPEDTNEQNRQAGLKSKSSTFQTQKQYLRNAILDIAGTTKSVEEFKRLLRDRYQVELTDKRGRFSFLHPDRNKNISERALGSRYTRAAIMEMLEVNKLGRATQVQEKMAKRNAVADRNMFSDLPPIFFIYSDLRLVVDLQTCVKAQQSRAYERKVEISNLKEMARTVAYVQENHFDTWENLQAEYDEINGKLSVARKTLRETEAKIRETNEQIHYTGQYLANKFVYSQFLKSHSKKKFQQEHRSEIELYEAAVKFLKKKNPDGKIPSIKMLKNEKAKLGIQKSAQQKTYDHFRDYQKELYIICTNVDAILRREQNQVRNQQLTK